MSESAPHETAEGHEHIKVPIRTPAGASHPFDLRPDQLVAEVVFDAVRYFVDHNELASGDYGLAVIRDGQAEPMVDTSRLEDYGITDADELQLIPEAPRSTGDPAPGPPGRDAQRRSSGHR